MEYQAVENKIYSGSEIAVLASDGEKIGRVLQIGQSFHARHECRHIGGVFATKEAAVEYVIGVDLAIEARFAGRLEVAA